MGSNEKLAGLRVLKVLCFQGCRVRTLKTTSSARGLRAQTTHLLRGESSAIAMR